MNPSLCCDASDECDDCDERQEGVTEGSHRREEQLTIDSFFKRKRGKGGVKRKVSIPVQREKPNGGGRYMQRKKKKAEQLHLDIREKECVDDGD